MLGEGTAVRKTEEPDEETAKRNLQPRGGGRAEAHLTSRYRPLLLLGARKALCALRCDRAIPLLAGKLSLTSTVDLGGEKDAFLAASITREQEDHSLDRKAAR